MIKFYHGIIGILCMMTLFMFPYAVNATDSSVFTRSPSKLLDDIYKDQTKSDTVQETALDEVNSTESKMWWADSTFSITNTLYSIQKKMHNYLQYVVYIGLSAAVIFLIWNGFNIITSSDKEKEMGEFKKNLKYIIVWVIILVAFYTIIDVFVGIVNLISR